MSPPDMRVLYLHRRRGEGKAEERRRKGEREDKGRRERGEGDAADVYGVMRCCTAIDAIIVPYM